jgi:hypothetical protein
MGKWKVSGFHCIGFRVVMGDKPAGEAWQVEKPFFQSCVKQKATGVECGPDMDKPYYRTRRLLYEIESKEMIDFGRKIGFEAGTGTNHHNGAMLVLDNGDLLACYYNGFAESHPELSICLFRLRMGCRDWDNVSVWPDFLDINDASPFLFNDAGTIWLGWGSPHLGGGYPFQWTTSEDNGQSWSQVKFPLFEGHPGGYRRKQPINAWFRGKDDVLYIAYDGRRGSSGLWATANNGRTWFAPEGRVNGLHATFVLLDDNTILSYGTRNTGIDGFCPKNVSRDMGKRWQVTRSVMPAQRGGQNPVMLKLASGRLLYVSDIAEAKDPNLSGFSGPGAYACLSEDAGDSWKIRKLAGGQWREKDGKAVEIRTVGYPGVAQAKNGVIHIVTSRNKPFMHIELNEAWILADDKHAAEAAAFEGSAVNKASLKRYKEFYSNGKVKAGWQAGVDGEGNYVLDGRQVFYYPVGKVQWEANFSNGKKSGIERYYLRDGKLKWEKEYKADGVVDWRVYGPDGTKKAESRWKKRDLLEKMIF